MREFFKKEFFPPWFHVERELSKMEIEKELGPEESC